MPQYPKMKALPELLKEVDNFLYPKVPTNVHTPNLYKKLIEFSQICDRPYYPKIQIGKAMRGNILVIDDDIEVFQELKSCLPAHNLHYAADLTGVKSSFTRKKIDLAIIDLNLQGDDSKDRLSGLGYIKRVHNRFPAVSIMVISQFSDVELVEEAIKNGAKRYKWKGELDPTEQAFREEINELINEKRKQDDKRHFARTEIWGNSPNTIALQEQLKEKAKTKDSFFLIGEPGVGKDNAINYLYYKSMYYSDVRPYEEIDFSIEKSARVLSVLRAEPSEKSKNFLKNAKNNILVLRNLQLASKEVQRIFCYIMKNRSYLHAPDNLLIQFIFVLEEKPQQLIAEKRLHRELLSYADSIYISPLRERKLDIPDLIDNWLAAKEYPSNLLSTEVIRVLKGYDYPGNSYELFAILDRSVDAHKRKHKNKWAKFPILLDSLPPELFEEEAPLYNMLLEVAKLELRYIERALHTSNGKKGKAAELLCIPSGADNLKKSYIDKYKKQFPGLLKQYPLIAKVYNLK